MSGDRRAYNLKTVLLGEGCVGKTSLVVRYVQDAFSENHATTLQASFLSKKISLRGGKQLNLSIWDTAGQERFHALGPIYYRDANGAILVYDITDQGSFLKVKKWVKELRKMLGTDICLAIVGNKTDLEAERRVDAQVAEDYARSVGAQHFNTSAKLNRGIEELFTDLAHRMVDVYDEKNKSSGFMAHIASSRSSSTSTAGGRISLSSHEPAVGSRVKSNCCIGGGDDEIVTGIPVDNETRHQQS